MSEPTADLETRLARLERRVEELGSRLVSLEAGSAPATSPAPSDDEAAPEPAAAARGEIWSGIPALLGRTLVVLGGAFLIRSLTESRVLSPALGVGLGVIYAFVWLLLADRAARRGQHLGGAFHALASALIVYPLLFEAATRLELLAPGVAAALLVGANALGLAVAWRRDFRVLAWIQQIATLAVAVPLLFRTRAPLALGLALLALAISSLALAYGRGWRGQRWLVAIGLDLVFALLLALRFLARTPPDWLPAPLVAALLAGFAIVYLAAFVLRLLVQGRRVTPFAITQTIAVVGIGFEGALATAQGSFRSGLAVGALAVGALLHGVLARRSEARWGHGAAMGYFSSVATYLAAEAVRILLPSFAATIWLLAAVALGILALGGERPILQVHAALLAAVATLQSGLQATAVAALLAPATAAWRPPSLAAWLAFPLAAVVVVLLYRGSSREGWRWLDGLARVLALSATLIAAGGLVIRWLGAAVAAAPGPDADAGRLAALRTVVLSISALGLAASALGLGRRELLRLAAVVLLVGGLKLVLEDLRLAGAGPLVVSLVFYGAALIAVPALARRLSPQSGDSPAPAD